MIIHLEEDDLFLREENFCLEEEGTIVMLMSAFCDVPALELHTYLIKIIELFLVRCNF